MNPLLSAWPSTFENHTPRPLRTLGSFGTLLQDANVDPLVWILDSDPCVCQKSVYDFLTGDEEGRLCKTRF